MKNISILKSSVLVFVLAFICVSQSHAQTITFDTNDYASISVYDPWALSPFRTGALTGNAAVVSNPNTAVNEVLGQAPNPTANVVGFQRSHYGSNTYGVRINLTEPFRLTKSSRYLHVMTYCPDKPTASRMMAIGLGKRVEDDWSWQDGEDEQFWALTSNEVEVTSEWQDIVFSFKGNSYAETENADYGIDIYAIVLVPDVASRHDDDDFIAYFDQLLIDDSSQPRYSTDYYPLNFDKGTTPTRTDRSLTAVGLTADGTTKTASGLGSLIYNDKTLTTVFAAQPGQSVQPTFTYTGAWMSGYVYVDWGSDGTFAYTLNADMTPAAGSDVVSYSGYRGNASSFYKSTGETVSNGNQIQSGVPAFTVPATTTCGFYRMRYKVDWDNIDPAGNNTSGNLLTANGGGVCDVMLDVHAATVSVTENQRNGHIVAAADSAELNNYQLTYGDTLQIKMVPAPGFTFDGIRVRYGYNLDQDQFDAYGNPRWFEKTYAYADFSNRCITLPASVLMGSNVLIEGLFVEGQETDTPEEGEQITSLSQLSNDKAYYIYNIYDCGYLVWNPLHSDTDLSIMGAKEDNISNTHGWPSDETIKGYYQQSIDPFDESCCWQILQKNGSWYLFQPAKACFVTCVGRTYQFTETETPLNGIKANTGDYANSFSFLAGQESYDESSKYFAVLATCNNTGVVANWTWNDNGGLFYIVENPNVEVFDIFADGLAGDVDKDSKVSIADVPNIVNVLRRRQSKRKEADVNLDNKIDIADKNSLINILLGL